MTDAPHIAYPLTLRAGRLVVNEQDSIGDVRSCVHVLLRTPLGARPLAPEVGLQDPSFTAGVDEDELIAMLGRFEPRAGVAISVSGPSVEGRQVVGLDVTLAAESDGGELPGDDT